MRKRLVLLGVIFLMLVIYSTMNSLGLFESEKSVDSELNLAKWVILFNGVDISENKTISLTDFEYEKNGALVDNDYFAPGVTAFYTLDIDTSNTDVSVDYEINMAQDITLNHPNIKFYVTLDDEEVTADDSSYSGTINFSDTKKVKTFKFKIDWEQDDAYNDADSLLINNEFAINLSVNFKQHV